MLQAHDFFDLNATAHSQLFDGTEYVWDAINNIEKYVKSLLASNFKPNSDKFNFHPSTFIEGDVYIGDGAVIDPGVYISGPTVIGANCSVKHGALIRGNVVMGDGAIVGHTTEVKNTAMLENAHAPHFAYVGDSILGRNTNLGAGTKLSNLPVTSYKDSTTNKRPTIKLQINGDEYDTGLEKFGAILGDESQTGCNSVLNPGCVIGASTLVYPLVSLGKGYYPPSSIIKLRQQIEIVERIFS